MRRTSEQTDRVPGMLGTARRPVVPRARWYRLYYLLAAFDLLTVAGSLALNHEIRARYARSVTVNQVWARHLDEYSNLGALAAAVDLPGNDVFDSHNPVAERARMHEALAAFDERLDQLQRDLRAEPQIAQTPQLLAIFDAIEAAVAVMTNESEQIFSYFARGEPDVAAQRMAALDHKYDEVLTALARLRDSVSDIQQANLDEQQAMVASLAKFEYAIAAAILLMIGAASAYGYRMARQVEADARERERYVAQLREAEGRTRSILETAADGIVTFDGQGTVESMNASAERMFGARAASILGQHVSRLIPSLSADTLGAAAWHRVLLPSREGAGDTLRGETVGRRAGETEFPLEIAIGGLRSGDSQVYTAVVRDVTERKQAALEERQRLGRDLHDTVTQSLYSLTLLAEAGRRLAAKGDLERTAHHQARIRDTAQQALKEMRLLVHELRPPALERVGLASALEQRLDAVERRAGVDARLQVDGTLDLPPSIEEGLYKIALEALNNALKHAGATMVTVHVLADGEHVSLTISDNGRGFAAALEGDRGGLGLVSMRERARQMGGSLDVQSVPGDGTRVRAGVGLARGVRVLA